MTHGVVSRQSADVPLRREVAGIGELGGASAERTDERTDAWLEEVQFRSLSMGTREFPNHDQVETKPGLAVVTDGVLVPLECPHTTLGYVGELAPAVARHASDRRVPLAEAVARGSTRRPEGGRRRHMPAERSPRPDPGAADGPGDGRRQPPPDSPDSPDSDPDSGAGAGAGRQLSDDHRRPREGGRVDRELRVQIEEARKHPGLHRRLDDLTRSRSSFTDTLASAGDKTRRAGPVPAPRRHGAAPSRHRPMS